MEFRELADKYNTPYYLYDFEKYKKQFEKIQEAFRGRKSLIAYAIKSNSNLSVVKLFADMGAGADCVSIGEIHRALKVGIPKYKIIFSGVGKRDEEIREALEIGILFINLESKAEMGRVEKIAKELGVVARISVRVNPNIDPQTHPYISTGLHENKFGVDIESAKEIYIHSKNSPHLEPVGVHFHIGSQLTQLDPIREASEKIATLVKHLKVLDIDLKFFDVGGGLGVQYSDEVLIPPYNYAQAILSTLSGLDVTVVLEPGRYLTAEGGYFVTSVLYEKQNSGDKRFVIVDGAMNDLLRPSLYNAFHRIEFIVGEGKKEISEKVSKADIVGPVCESGDFFGKDRYIPTEIEHGDLVIVHTAGAYGFVMSSNYNSRSRPPELAFENGEYRTIRERESFETLIELEEKFI
jgi:diaminopimelate decarboxylase